ncbi:MAG: glycoside hydrolase family 88 protein [Spirochaetaceae bacterium]|jgi:unsaturated chondroitin disaccharide hydrolase|nr:glycoside hydrolase family 88 protein [Spirochaetaceae bacterium]
MNSEKIFTITGNHLKNMISSMGDTIKNPRSSEADGSVRYVESKDWTSGFFPGCLWFQYEFTEDTFWKEMAEKYSSLLEGEQFDNSNHDVGFKMFCSYGNGFRLKDGESYKKILIESATTLASRYNSITRCIRSWDHNRDKWEFPVIIDNMLNLELLFWASKESGQSNYFEIAKSHALTTLANHFRIDNSCYHVVDYNASTGLVQHKHTHQGYSHKSAWARGQAWAIYGYTMCYRETGIKEFLHQAVKVTDFVMNHKNLPEDGIPYWDFDDPAIPKAPRDASAAAVICSGLYELYQFLGNDGIKYRDFADSIFKNLTSREYLAEIGENNNFILKQSTGNFNKDDEVDKPLIYADYYFMEAALRRSKLGQNDFR